MGRTCTCKVKANKAAQNENKLTTIPWRDCKGIETIKSAFLPCLSYIHSKSFTYTDATALKKFYIYRCIQIATGQIIIHEAAHKPTELPLHFNLSVHKLS